MLYDPSSSSSITKVKLRRDASEDSSPAHGRWNRWTGDISRGWNRRLFVHLLRGVVHSLIDLKSVL